VVIDFSLPAALETVIAICKKYQKPLVIGTTGYNEAELNHIKAASQEIAILKSANMSIGANLLTKLAGVAAHFVESDFAIDIIETHHKFKKDAPSGTALMIGDSIQKGSPHEVVYHSLRGGDAIGEHQVVLTGNGERLVLEHLALNRNIFAKGALKAAEFIIDQAPGLYSFMDIIDLQMKGL
jgi:4-hydroxy-tetrahydrodipicolinate reductase